ncbi:MAG: hypothetical protein ABEI77_09455 [Halorientalis sp.]
MAGGGINRTLNGTAIITATESGDGGLLLGGMTGFRNGNATLRKLSANGSTVWTRHYRTENRSGIVAVERGPNDRLYAIQYAADYNRTHIGSYRMWLVGLTDRGEIRWRKSLNTSRIAVSRETLAVGETGPALAYRNGRDGNVTLQQYGTDGDLRWNRTYTVDAGPRTLDVTQDGYVMTGTVSYEHPWVLRTDSQGAVRSNRTYDRLDVQQLVGAKPTADGGVILAGTYSGHFAGSHPWAAKVGSDGIPQWSRVYPGDASSNVNVQTMFPDGDGITLVGTGRDSSGTDSSGYFVGVGPNGSERYVKRVAGFMQTVAVPGPNRTVTVAGLDGYPTRNVTTVVRTVALPAMDGSHERQTPVPINSDKRFYRGQQPQFVRPSAAGESVDLVAVPGEYDDFSRHVVRRIPLDDRGRATIDSTTLEDGTYYLRTTDGKPLVVTSGWALKTGNRDSAQFTLRTQDLYSFDSDSTYVDRASGDETATLRVNTDRKNYALYVSADRFRGGQVGADTLKQLFADDSVRIEQYRGQPVARIPASGQQNLTLTVGSVDAGLYDLTLRGTDTGTAGASMDHRLIVGSKTQRPLGVSLANTTLSVPLDGEAATNVTVSNLTDGIGAMSMSANRTGPPAIDVSVDLNINATRMSASSGWSDDSSDADAQAMDAHTANGTVDVGTLSVEANDRSLDPTSSPTNTVTFRLDWVVDENGVPYTIPGDTTATVTVEHIENATGEYHDHRGHARGSASASGTVRARAP